MRHNRAGTDRLDLDGRVPLIDNEHTLVAGPLKRGKPGRDLGPAPVVPGPGRVVKMNVRGQAVVGKAVKKAVDDLRVWSVDTEWSLSSTRRGSC